MPRIKTIGPRLSSPAHSMVPMLETESVSKRLKGKAAVQRRAKYMMDNPLCVHCTAEGRTSRAEELDHIQPLWNGGVDHQVNFQPLCRHHHALKTAKEAEQRWRSGGAYA